MVEIDELTLHWLAGLLEGEATFSAGRASNFYKPAIAVQMIDEDVIAKVAAIFQVSVMLADTKRALENGWKQSYMARVNGERAVQLMKLLYPLMGSRRKQQIDRALESYSGDRRKVLKPEQVEELKRRLHGGEHVIQLANEFGVSKSYAYLVRGKQT